MLTVKTKKQNKILTLITSHKFNKAYKTTIFLYWRIAYLKQDMQRVLEGHDGLVLIRFTLLPLKNYKC